MKRTLSQLLVASTVVLTALSAIGPVAAQTTDKAAQPPATSPAATAPQDKATDYLVRVGKHTMWKSQVETMHPELKPKMVPITKANKNDFLVQVGKSTVWASTLRRDPNAETRPASHDKACKDYPVEIGKKIVWASSAQCPMGKHTKDAKPLCCVAPLADMAKMPKCCQDAAK